MWVCSPEIEVALWAAARDRLDREALRGEALARAVVARSRLYTSERETPSGAGGEGLRELSGTGRRAEHGPEVDLAARALFFTVADAAKVAVPLAELKQRWLIGTDEPLRVLDVGAGAGAMTLGAIDYLQPRALEILAVDRDRAALDVLRCAFAELPRGWREGVDLSVRVADACGTGLEPTARGYDLILVGSLLNELAAEAQRALVRRLLAAVSDRGALILIEPALRETSRALHQLRDYVLDSRLAFVFAPCVRSAAPCPALAEERDWCHEDRPTQLPERAARIARATGLRRHGIKFSYLVLRREPEGLIGSLPAFDDRRALRVVSQPRKLKGRRELFACGDCGRVSMRLLTRHRSARNRAFERARRGDVLIVGARDEIGPDAQVELRTVNPRAPGE